MGEAIEVPEKWAVATLRGRTNVAHGGRSSGQGRGPRREGRSRGVGGSVGGVDDDGCRVGRTAGRRGRGKWQRAKGQREARSIKGTEAGIQRVQNEVSTAIGTM
eukprot:scaffold15080_cov94-Amphora_coffeaeformis.AAC.2